MTYTPRLQSFDTSVKALRRELAKAEDDLLEHADREKRLGRLADEGDRELAAEYGI